MFANPWRILAAVEVLIVLGLASAVAGQPAPAVQPAWKTFEKKAFHFSVSLPTGWKAIDLDPGRIDSSLDELAAANPELGKAFGPQVRGLMRSGVKFMAVDAAADVAKEKFAHNLNVIYNPQPTKAGLTEYLAEGVAEVKGLSGIRGEVTHGPIQVGGGHPAARLRFRIHIDPANGDEVVITQVYVLTHGGSLVFTFTTTPARLADYEPVFAAITERIRILD